MVFSCFAVYVLENNTRVVIYFESCMPPCIVFVCKSKCNRHSMWVKRFIYLLDVLRDSLTNLKMDVAVMVSIALSEYTKPVKPYQEQPRCPNIHYKEESIQIDNKWNVTVITFTAYPIIAFDLQVQEMLVELVKKFRKYLCDIRDTSCSTELLVRGIRLYLYHFSSCVYHC